MQTISRCSLFAIVLLFAVYPFSLIAFEDNYTLEFEARSYPNISGDSSQFDDNSAASFEPEFKQSFNNDKTISIFTVFGRWDSRDPMRRHSDIREMHLLHAAGSWETLIGFSRVFWGVTESNHLVDIVNQTDALEGFDGEDKLGQAMIRLSRSFEQSTLTLFALPGFREREFLSSDNPLALPFAINNDPLYDSPDGKDHVDYAVRFSGYRGIVDYGLSWFSGTSRQPDFVPGDDGRLIPFYAQIDQLGLDLQITSDAWLWKLETIRRQFDNDTSGEDFTAAVGGLEYSFFGVADGLYDLGLLAEYHYDSRGDVSTVPFQDDLFLGLRFGFTDTESSEILAGTIIDQEDQTTSFRIEASRRVFTDARINLEGQVFNNVDPDNAISYLRDSDFLRLSLELYF
ncbi:MAG: hypothetical protein P8Y12_08015 [Gammaproteobacteria bacterium]